MEREERQHAKGVPDEVSGWMKRAAKLVDGRQKVAGEAEKASAELAQRLLPRGPNGQVPWRTVACLVQWRLRADALTVVGAG